MCSVLICPILCRRAVAGEAWYALSESIDAPPYGYQYYSGEEPSVYGGKPARKASLRMVYSVVALGERTDWESYREFYMEPGGGLMGFAARLKAGAKGFVCEGEFKQDGLYVRKYEEGSPPKDAPQKLTPPADVLFVVSPSFLWPLVQDRDAPVSFRLFDVFNLTHSQAAATPAGIAEIRLPGGKRQAKKYTLQTTDAATGAVASQAMYFDPRSGQLLLSENLDPSASTTSSIAYLADKKCVAAVRPRVVKPDVFPARSFPLKPDNYYRYVVRVGKDEMGRGFIFVSPTASVGKHQIEETVRIIGPQEERTSTANINLAGNLTLVRYALTGKVADPTGKVTNISYNRSALWNGQNISWETWRRDEIKTSPADTDRGSYQLSDELFIMDSHLVSGFAALASQIPIQQGRIFKVGVFHASMHKIGIVNLIVRDKIAASAAPGTAQSKSIYSMDLIGFFGRFVLFVDEDGLLRRAVQVMGPDGERDISYDLLL
jgi:hypothetical protein